MDLNRWVQYDIGMIGNLSLVFICSGKESEIRDSMQCIEHTPLWAEM